MLKTVVEEDSFLRTPQKLCCTQSTVTFHVQQLEWEPSVQSFGKIGRRMCLTSEGKRLMSYIRDLTRIMVSIRQLAYQDTQPGGDLRVAIDETLLAYRMPQVLQRFKQRVPHVRLSSQSLNCYVVRDALLSDDVGLGVFYQVGGDDALELIPLGDQSLALITSPLLQHVDFIQHDQHIPCSFIINEPQCIFRQRFEGLLRRRQVTLEDIIELWSIKNIKQHVSTNLGINLLPHFAVEKELRSGELIELPFSEWPELITALCGYHTGKVVSPAVRVFLGCIEESFASCEKMLG